MKATTAATAATVAEGTFAAAGAPATEANQFADEAQEADGAGGQSGTIAGVEGAGHPKAEVLEEGKIAELPMATLGEIEKEEEERRAAESGEDKAIERIANMAIPVKETG